MIDMVTKNFIKTRKRYNVNFYELNTNCELKESTFFLFLQDVATENAEVNGFGYDDISKNNFGWFLLKYHIELTQYPKGFEYIEIETESRGAAKLFAFRDFTIYNPNGDVIGRVASCWALIDMVSKTMIPVQKQMEDFLPYSKRENDLVFNKIKTPVEFDSQKSFDVRFDDIDVNHHANNSNYISWALEALPYDFRIKNSLKNIDIQIKKDITVGETVLSKVKINNELNQTIHLILNKNSGEDLALLSIDWN